MLDTIVFKKGMEMMCTLANREPSDLLLDTYYALLKELEDQQYMTAVTNVLRIRKYTTLPLPADILEAACGKVDDEALIALDKLERAMSTWGAYRTVVFDDPVIHAIVQSFGGWPKTCRMENDEWKFRRKDFLKVYCAFAPNLHRLQIPLRLTGVDELSNPSIAYQPIMLGNGDITVEWWSHVKQVEHTPQSTGEIMKMLEVKL